MINSLFVRIPTFILGLLVVAAVVLYPRFIATDMKSVPHGWVVLLMIGMSCCFISGVGFKPKNKYLRMFFSVPVAWILVLVSGGWLLYHGPLGRLLFG